MSREFSSHPGTNTTIIDTLDDDTVLPAYFLHISDISGEDDIWLSTMNRDYTMNIEGTNQTFIGAGDIVTISKILEPTDLRSNGITISVNGLQSDVLDLALNANYQNGKLRLGFAVLKSSLADTPPYPYRYSTDFPTILFQGKIDRMVIQDSGDLCNLQVSIENRLATFERSDHLRFTDEDQRARTYVGGGSSVDIDYALKHIPVIQKRVLKWKASS